MADPILRDWRLIAGDETALGILVGEVSGHPLLPNGWITTSAVAEVSGDHTWARTASRWYSLGVPLPDDQPLPPAATDAILERLLRTADTPLPSMEVLHRLVALAEKLSQAPRPSTH